MSKSIAATAAIAVVLLIGAPAKQAGAMPAPGATNDDSVRHRSGPQPELVGAWGGYGPGLFRRGFN